MYKGSEAQGKIILPTARELELDDLWGPFQPKPFYIIWFQDMKYGEVGFIRKLCYLTGSYFSFWDTVTAFIPQKAQSSLRFSCLQKQKPASAANPLNVLEGMYCNYLCTLHLFNFNWKAKAILKFSLSNWSFLFLLFLDVQMTSRWNSMNWN